MAFDGIVISNVVRDMKEKLIDGRIYKIYQPEKDELNIVIKNNRRITGCSCLRMQASRLYTFSSPPRRIL